MIATEGRRIAVDLRSASETDLADLATATSELGSIVVADQHLHGAELETFVARLGPLMFTPGETPLPGTDFVFEVTNRGRTDTPRSVFHTDTSYVERPPSYSVLSAVEIPIDGGAGAGDTVVVDLRAATATLPAELAAQLVDVELLHVASRVPRPDEAGDGAWHPILRHHPDLDETILFLSAHERMVAARRSGGELEPDEAIALIDEVWAHAQTGPHHRHRWAPGDVLIMDNRVALHRADHADVTGVRTLHRVMVRGECPVVGAAA